MAQKQKKEPFGSRAPLGYTWRVIAFLLAGFLVDLLTCRANFLLDPKSVKLFKNLFDMLSGCLYSVSKPDRYS